MSGFDLIELIFVFFLQLEKEEEKEEQQFTELSKEPRAQNNDVRQDNGVTPPKVWALIIPV